MHLSGLADATALLIKGNPCFSHMAPCTCGVWPAGHGATLMTDSMRGQCHSACQGKCSKGLRVTPKLQKFRRLLWSAPPRQFLACNKGITTTPLQSTTFK
jgi:hypothetical protein